MFGAHERLPGPSPSSFQVFFRSSSMSSEAALFVCICRIVGARSPASLESGERLCEAFEIYREWEPAAEFEFEQAVLLLIGASEGEKIALEYCPHCSAAFLVDKLDGARRTCARCKRKGAMLRRRRLKRERGVGTATSIPAATVIENSVESRDAFGGTRHDTLSPANLVREQRDQAVVQEERHAKAQR